MSKDKNERKNNNLWVISSNIVSSSVFFLVKVSSSVWKKAIN